MEKSSTKVNFKLQNLRKEKNMSCEDMAKELGICKAYYWQLENGNRRLYYDLTLKIAKIFNLKPDDIFYDYYK
ncbi:MAG: helix-turn-helix transcriptional regulator [Firmicutes bacterium]|nr:helix-turn-helix transcriptional regulator [Bacillota bacterium]